MQRVKFINFYTICLMVIAAGFFFTTSWLVISVWQPNYRDFNHLIYSWPDAMANQAFVNQYIQTGSLVIPNQFNAEIKNILHPRSVNVYQGNLVPMTFLGLLLIYGLLGKIIGIAGALFLTPLFGGLAVFCSFYLFRRLMSARSALITVLLLATLAPMIYYSSLVMLHTVLFVSLLIIGLTILVSAAKPDLKFHGETSGQTRPLNLSSAFKVSLGGLIIGLSLTVRTVEAPWVLLMAGILFLFSKKPIRSWRTAAIFIIFLALAFAPVLYFNNILYGEPLSAGYLKMDNSGNPLERLPAEFQIQAAPLWQKIAQAIVIPFGLNIKNLLKTGFQFWVLFFGPYLLLSVFGLGWFIFNKNKTRAQKIYLIMAAVSAAWLIFYYGNWQFDDLDTLKYNTIGSSYMRYWLPAFILLLPGIGYLFDRLQALKIRKILSASLIITLVGSLICYSIFWAYQTPRDGLLALKNTLTDYYLCYEKTSQAIPNDAIMIVDRTDKLFWPKHQVVVFLLNYDIFSGLAKIIGRQPIYYLTAMPDKDVDYINRSRINEYELEFVNPRVIDDYYRLFELQAKSVTTLSDE